MFWSEFSNARLWKNYRLDPPGHSRPWLKPEALGSSCGHQCLLTLARGMALFISSFTLVNLLGQFLVPGFDANVWWIDLRSVGISGRIILAGAVALLLAYSLRPNMSSRRRTLTAWTVAGLMITCLCNSAQFYWLLARHRIQADYPVAFSVFMAAALAVILKAVLMHAVYSKGKLAVAGFVVVSSSCLLAFPLGQIYCFGKTDYQRPAQVIVVFGSRVYADGEPSGVVADRMRTACELFNKGLAEKLILSGGPGDGAIHETQAMRQMAIELGVPAESILIDPDGLSTQATVNNTVVIFRRLGIRRVLAVSHFYHLPRIKLAYQRQGFEVYTVPAMETFVLHQMPAYVCREIPALWVYYLRSLLCF